MDKILVIIFNLLEKEGILKCRFSLAWPDSVSMRYELGMREAAAAQFSVLLGII